MAKKKAEPIKPRAVITKGVKSRGNRKLTDEQVINIVERQRAGERQADLAREHNVTSATVSSIMCGKTYVWLTGIGVETLQRAA